MKATALHSWQVSTHEAIAIQRLRAQIITENMLGELRYIAGADIATSKDSPKAYAGVVVLSYPTLEVVEERGLEDGDFSLHSWSLGVSRRTSAAEGVRTVDH